MLSQLRPDWNIELLPGSLEEAGNWLAGHPDPELVFSDIHLSDGNAFEILEKISPRTAIIFTTAYDEYAVRAFTLNSIDYLLKPIDPNRLEQALQRFESRRQSQMPGWNKALLDNLIDWQQGLSQANIHKKYRTRFLISGPDRLVTLPVEQVALFYTENRTTCAITRKNERYPVDLPLEKLEEQLNPEHFFRTNRQSIVHVDSIVRIEPYFNGKVVVHTRPEAPEKITVSKERSTAFKQWLNY